MMGAKMNSSRDVAMATDFLNNANGLSNHHIEIFPVYHGLYKNLQIKMFFHRFCKISRSEKPQTWCGDCLDH